MCVIIYKPAQETIPKQKLREAYKANPDGCGFMWGNSWGIVNIVKGCWSFDEFMYHYYLNIAHREDRAAVIHFRTASSSNISFTSCHPFWISPKLAFAHNGNLFEFSKYYGNARHDNRSDTQIFNDEILKNLPKNFLNVPKVKSTLSHYCIESMSKMVFMDASGKVTIINEQAGYWQDGIWYSNGGIKNYSGYGYSGAYSYMPGDVRHKGGLLSVQLFPEKSREKWRQCNLCRGWYLTETIENGICKGCETLEKLKEMIKIKCSIGQRL